MKIYVLDLLLAVAIFGFLTLALISVNSVEFGTWWQFLFGPILIAGFSSPFEPSGLAFFQNDIELFWIGIALAILLSAPISSVLFRPGKWTLLASIASTAIWAAIGVWYLHYTIQMHR